MTRFASVIALFLSLAVALTAHQMIVLRGHNMAAGQMVLCTGTGPVTVYFDEDGNPTSPPHICPECALAMFDATTSDQSECVVIERAGSLVWGFATQYRLAIIQPEHVARGPPVAI